MSWSFKILRVAGIEVRVHFTFVLFLAWIGWSYYVAGGWPAAQEAVLFMLALFACVLLHEFGHALTALRYGIHTPDITLLPIGGLARLERMPEKPSQELLVAIAGPAVNLVIAAVLLALGYRMSAQHLEGFEHPGAAFLAKLTTVNIGLVLFNLVPAFPMDGGRVLRALLAMRLDHVRATRIAARVGQGFAIAMGFAGLIWNQPMLLFIAVFVFFGAMQEASAAEMKGVATHLRVSDAMLTQVTTLPATATLDEAVEALLRTSQHEFPVIDLAGRVAGILTRDAMIAALKRHGPAVAVADAMHRDVPFVRDYAPFDEAFEMMNTCGCPAIPVLDRHDQLVGLITPENIGELMLVRSVRGPHAAVHDWRAGRPRAGG